VPQALRVGLCVGPDDPDWVLVREAIYQRAEQFALYRILESGLSIICASESGIRHPRFVSPVALYGAAQMVGRCLVERLSGRDNVLSAGMNTVGVHRWFVVI
jgi:hypothetical protein